MSSTTKKTATAKKPVASATASAAAPVIETPEITPEVKTEDEEHESVGSEITIEYVGEPGINEHDLKMTIDETMKGIMKINAHLFPVLSTLSRTSIKPFETQLKGLNKEYEKLNSSMIKVLFQLFSSQTKVKKNKIPKTEEETKNLSINKEYEGLPHFIDFVKPDDGKTTFSRADVQRAINNHIKAHPELIHKYEIDGKEKKDTFILTGELGLLFHNIKLEMERRALTTSDAYPLLSVGTLKYKDILRYVSYCLVPAPKKA